MRSELVLAAATQVPNRYLLVRLTSKTMRIFHTPFARLEETANDVLRIFSYRTNAGALSPHLFTGPESPRGSLEVKPYPGKSQCSQPRSRKVLPPNSKARE